MGDAARATDDLDGARAAYAEEIAVFAALKAPDAASRRQLAVADNKLGAVLKAKGDLAGAIAAHRDALALARALGAEDPASALYRADLAFTDEALADALQAARRRQRRRSTPTARRRRSAPRAPAKP